MCVDMCDGFCVCVYVCGCLCMFLLDFCSHTHANSCIRTKCTYVNVHVCVRARSRVCISVYSDKSHARRCNRYNSARVPGGIYGAEGPPICV